MIQEWKAIFSCTTGCSVISFLLGVRGTAQGWDTTRAFLIIIIMLFSDGALRDWGFCEHIRKGLGDFYTKEANVLLEDHDIPAFQRVSLLPYSLLSSLYNF